MKEKGGVEPECSKSLRHWGWQPEKTRDGLRCPNCGTMIYPDSAPGTFDYEAYVPMWEQKEMRHIYVEVKSGETSLSFNRLEDSQAEFAEEVRGRDERIDLWMWVCIGRGIGYNDYPRETFLFPYEKWWQMQDKLDRKSIPHGYERLKSYRLDWVVCGGGLWLLPQHHPARTIYGYQTGEADD
jgi:hypothetical protein